MDFPLCYAQFFFHPARCFVLARQLINICFVLVGWPCLVVTHALSLASPSIIVRVIIFLLITLLFSHLMVWADRRTLPLAHAIARATVPYARAVWWLRLRRSAWHVSVHMLIQHKIPMAISNMRWQLRMWSHDVRWQLSTARIQRVLDGYVDPWPVLQRAAGTSALMLGSLCLTPLVSAAAGTGYTVLWSILVLSLLLEPTWTLRIQLERPGIYYRVR